MRVQIVGRGRMATALEAALGGRGGDVELLPLMGREAAGRGIADAGEGAASLGAADADVVLLAVPDTAIGEVARGIVPGPLVGHLSGATGLDVLDPHEAFGLHPLLTVTGPGTSFAGAHAAVAGTTERALAAALKLAGLLGLKPFRIADADRAAYHAAASVSSNFLLALERFAEALAETAGVPRAALVPLVRETVDNWAARGAARALTGPIARGDEATVGRQRAAVAERMPERLALFDRLAEATRELAGEAGEEVG